MPLHFDILTIFPGVFESVLGESIPERAHQAGLFDVSFTDLRDFTHDRHRSVDDRPYGGGPGMVLKPEPVFEAVESVLERRRAPPEVTRKLIMAPRGRPLRQADLRELACMEWILILCGHYEGFDERVFEGLGFEPVSIGDYVLSGGELPAMVVLDGVVRLLPGALGHPESSQRESFEQEGWLDHPHYTRPPVFRGMAVPDVLQSGHHGEIDAWRRREARERTARWRPDLMSGERSRTSGRSPSGEPRQSDRTPSAGRSPPSGKQVAARPDARDEPPRSPSRAAEEQ